VVVPTIPEAAEIVPPFEAVMKAGGVVLVGLLKTT